MHGHRNRDGCITSHGWTTELDVNTAPAGRDPAGYIDATPVTVGVATGSVAFRIGSRRAVRRARSMLAPVNLVAVGVSFIPIASLLPPAFAELLLCLPPSLLGVLPALPHEFLLALPCLLRLRGPTASLAPVGRRIAFTRAEATCSVRHCWCH
jgi:hypothetical protein